jgi:hypothetical protein
MFMRKVFLACNLATIFWAVHPERVVSGEVSGYCGKDLQAPDTDRDSNKGEGNNCECRSR